MAQCFKDAEGINRAWATTMCSCGSRVREVLFEDKTIKLDVTTGRAFVVRGKAHPRAHIENTYTLHVCMPWNLR